MRIEKLEIKGFGRLKNVTMLFDKGLNIIYGKNEAGKSTIQWFIKAMLFGLKGGKAAKDGTPPPLKRYKPWSHEDYSGFLEYRLDDGQIYRIGRNFSTNSVRIFDSLFNDITNTFDMSKEKGVHFAEKHLGLNEACFDRTAFIRQMEARIGEDGRQELYNRIINISETGQEDISFKKGQEALKEALKSYVGTDKTSTRPLDKILDRLSELGYKKEELLNRRNSAFGIENELGDAYTKKNNLENQKTFLERLRGLNELRKQFEERAKVKIQARETLDGINSDEKELSIIKGRAEDFSKVKEEYNYFSAYDNEDIDELDRQYQKLRNMTDSNEKLRAEIADKERELNAVRRQMEPIMAFGELGEGIENYVVGISRDLEYLKKDYQKNNLEVLNEKIKNTEQRVKNYRLQALLSGFIALVLFGIGFVDLHMSFVVSFAAFIFSIIFLCLKMKTSKELSALLDEKRISFINTKGVLEEINKKQDSLVKIYEKVGAEGIEDFLRLKADYDTQSRIIAAGSGDMDKLENEYTVHDREISRVRGNILSMLMEAGIIPEEAVNFDEEHIKRFKNGVRRYKGIEPSMNYTTQRQEDVERSLEKHFKSAAAICGEKFESKERLEEKIGIIDEELRLLGNESKRTVDGIMESMDESPYLNVVRQIACGIEDSQGSRSELTGIFSSVEEEYDKICRELSNILLNIREYETLLRNSSSDDSELREIEEEMNDLEGKKSRLEDVNISLKTALDVLSEASEELQKDFVPVLNYKMADVIQKITGGRYEDLRADSAVSLKAVAPETGEIVPASALSGGTADQMYLALRLAVADMAAEKGEKLPFIMDEVFAQYDDFRTRETFEYLKQLSEESQIIFFTCKSRELEIARQVFGSGMNAIKLSN